MLMSNFMFEAKKSHIVQRNTLTLDNIDRIATHQLRSIVLAYLYVWHCE